MERWQSTYEHRVRYNLSESGVHPLTAAELCELSGRDALLYGVRLGYGQSNGSDELRALIAADYPGATDASVLVTAGGAEANFVTLWELFEPNTSVAVVLPSYQQVPGLVESFGGRVAPVPLLEDEAWQPDLDALERALRDGARCVVVTHPNNPTGAVLAPGSMETIAELTERHGAWILADEVYQGAELGDERTPSFWRSHDRVLVVNSLSKAYGLPGLRLGWVVGPDDAVASLWGRTDYTTIAPASLSDGLARIALEPATRAKLRERTKEIVRGNLAVLEGWLGEQGDRFAWRPPDAGAICFIRYAPAIGSLELAEKLRLEKDVLVVPGDHFARDHHVRIGYGIPEAELREALGRVRETFDEVEGR